MRFFMIILSIFISINPLGGCKPKPQKAVASAQHYATDVGMMILNQGGNAFDAAIAMHYALAVVHPCCGNIGGGGVMTAYLNDGSSTVVDFREHAPKSLTSIDVTSHNPIHQVGIPGSVLGMQLIHDQYASMPMNTLIEPAIKLAEEGYTLEEGDSRIYRFAEKTLKQSPEAYQLFYPEGQAPKPGQIIKQKNLAKTLTIIRDQGPDSFYRGEISNAILAKSYRNEGKLTPSDFTNYQVKKRTPLHCQYRQHEIITASAPFSGLTLCQSLALIEPMTPNPALDSNPQGMLRRIASIRQAYADRAQYISDPDFYTVNPQLLLDESHLKSMRKKIEDYVQNKHSVIGKKLDQEDEGMHTTAFVVADEWGNVVSMTTTLNSYFGSGVYVEDYGFFLNNEMSDFDHDAPKSINAIEPYKRPRSGMTPTIVLYDQAPVIALGSPGGGTIPTQIINMLVKLIDQKLSIEEALKAPRFFPRWNQAKIHIEPGVFNEATTKALRECGEALMEGMGFIPGIPSWGAIALLQKKSNRWLAGMDPRRPAGSASVSD